MLQFSSNYGQSVSLTQPPVAAYFDESNPKWFRRCFCNSFHVVMGTKVLLGVLILSMIVNIGLGVFAHAHEAVIFFTSVNVFLCLIVLVCTIRAVKRERHCFMWPLVIYAVCLFALSLIGAIGFLTFPIFYPENFSHKEYLFREIFTCILCEILLILLVIYAYFQMRIICRCKKYFQDKAMARSPISTISYPQDSVVAQHYAQANGYDQAQENSRRPFGQLELMLNC